MTGPRCVSVACRCWVAGCSFLWCEMARAEKNYAFFSLFFRNAISERQVEVRKKNKLFLNRFLFCP